MEEQRQRDDHPTAGRWGPSSVDENPLLRLDYDLPQFVAALATAMRSPSANSTLRRQGGTGSLSTVAGDSEAANASVAVTPQLRFTTDGDSVLGAGYWLRVRRHARGLPDER